MKKKKFTVLLEPLGKKIRVPTGTPLQDILFNYGIEFPCGGKGTCGGCAINLLKGDIFLDEKGRKLQNRLHLRKDQRLACQSRVTEDVTLAIDQFETFILADQTEFEFTPGTGFGIAVDIGTTTLVAQLLDLETGHVLDVATALNSQSKHGADIISRIEFATLQHGQEHLRDMIREEIRVMTNKLIQKNRVDVSRVILVGNSVMQHIFCDIDLTPLSSFPFISQAQKFTRFTSRELGLKAIPNAEIIFLPNLGSFVGSDILAGILATGIHKKEKPVVLVDLGTNGEIVIGNKDEILFSSTAAGPAFEGSNISMGMRATSGAISSVTKINGKSIFHVIGNEKPRGICGSGLIDAIAVCLEKQKIDSGGKITESDRIDLIPPVFLTQKDIRELQLAKGAIAAGIEILIHRLGLKHGDIEEVFISGAFGNFINLENTREIGLLEFPEEKITKLGNSALIGAKMALFMTVEEIKPVLPIAKHISLETISDFQDIFAGKMMF